MDGHRHSVDIPLSKTLVALKRVRSLRDPSTNSLTKFSAFVDNLNLETDSNNEIALQFMNGREEGEIEKYDVLRSKGIGSKGPSEEHIHSKNLHCGSRKPISKLKGDDPGSVLNNVSIPMRKIDVQGPNLCQSNQDVVYDTQLLSEGHCNNYKDNDVDLAMMLPTGDCSVGVGSCNNSNEISLWMGNVNHNASKQQSQCRKQITSSGMETGDLMSCTVSPCVSTSSPLFKGLSSGIPSHGNEPIDILDVNYHGCGISCCWSKAPRFKGNIPSDMEDESLLSEPFLSEQRGWKHDNQESNLYLESPKSLSQKFRPKSFHELVGQNDVAKSLLSAISNRRTSPFYLFHGPRGTGKTSASRIFAAALNCLALQENKPCGLCRECVLFFNGKSRDVKEVESISVNRAERIRHLIKTAVTPPVSSRFKVFILDECHLLQGSTWATLLSNFDDLSQHAIFIMITHNLDKLPRSVVSRFQRYHFPKIKETDIVTRLEQICVVEGFEYDQVALHLIATKSNGSLRDAETLLEQLSLLGKRITISLAYELIGIVSDDELLDLLDLALSSDTSNIVRRARELMRTRIDPMQLISQLANLIMDILSGKCKDSNFEVRKKFLERNHCEADFQRLSHALKILSDTEKQLRTSKNQITWLTVALLQFSSASSSFDTNDSRLCPQTIQPRDGDICSTLSTSESLNHLVTCACDNNDLCKFGMHDKRTLQSIWNRATEICESNSLKNFLKKQGKLSSLCLNKGCYVVELEFHSQDYASRAEKSWKLIACALQSILGCNVEIRINLVRFTHGTRYSMVKKPLYGLLRRARGMHHKPQSYSSDPSENSNFTCEKAMIRRDTSVGSCETQISHVDFHGKEATRTIRNSDGNALSVGVSVSQRLLLPDKHDVGVHPSKEDEALAVQEPKKRCGCFPRAMKLSKMSHSLHSS